MPPPTHDEMLAALVRDPQSAMTVMRRFLPTPLVSRLSGEPPKLLDSTLPRPEGASIIADAFFEISLRSESKIVAHFQLIDALFEHKSRNYLGTPLQLLGYMMARWGQAHDKVKLGSLRGIVPVVLFHGSETCTIPQAFSELVDVPRDLATELRLLDFGVNVHHLKVIPSDELVDDPGTRGILNVMSLCHVTDISFSEVERVIEDLLVRPPESVVRIKGIEYAFLRLNVAQGERQKLLQSHIPEVRMMGMTMAQGWLEEGRAEGRAEGREEGREKGREEGREEGRTEERAEKLLMVLKARFSTVPSEVEARIRRASATDLQEWFVAALTAKRLDQVFS